MRKERGGSRWEKRGPSSEEGDERRGKKGRVRDGGEVWVRDEG